MKYHFIAAAVLLARTCQQEGLPLTVAYSLGTAYSQRMDECLDRESVEQVHDQMALDYAGRMLALGRQRASSRWVAEAMDYIFSHMSERITVEDIARAVKVSPSCLSRTFKQELGVSIGDYIRARRLDMAKNLLRHSDDSLKEIADRLAFSSVSHFIYQFRSLTGTTPRAYRNSGPGISLDKPK